jgi:hypothetical protein
MNILILANHYAVASGRYCLDALRRLGHTVYSVGPEHGGFIWGLKLPDAFTWQPNPPYPDTPIDLILIMDSDPALLPYAPVLREQYKAPVVVYGVDNHVRDYRAAQADHYFLAHKAVTIQPFEDNTTWLPCAYDPLFTPSLIPMGKRRYDVVLLGVMYEQRRALVERLRAAGLSVLAGTGLVYEAYRDAHHDARISLCLSARGDVAQRIFESAAMGCCIVSDPCGDFEALGIPGVWEIETDAVDEIRTILAFPAMLEEKAQQAQTWAMPHTWDARCKAIVDWRHA